MAGQSSSEADCAASIISNGTKLKHKILDSLEVKLENEGFEKFETTLAGDGVGILWPAVLHNGNEEEGGEEIDQDKFLMAEGTVGIERLVGVAGPRKRLTREAPEGSPSARSAKAGSSGGPGSRMRSKAERPCVLFFLCTRGPRPTTPKYLIFDSETRHLVAFYAV